VSSVTDGNWANSPIVFPVNVILFFYFINIFLIYYLTLLLKL
jgi:hypothetical protein